MIRTHIHRAAPRILFAFGVADDDTLWKTCDARQQSLMWKAGLVLLLPDDCDAFGVAKLVGFPCITAPGAMGEVSKIGEAELFTSHHPCWGQGALRFSPEVTDQLRSAAR